MLHDEYKSTPETLTIPALKQEASDLRKTAFVDRLNWSRALRPLQMSPPRRFLALACVTSHRRSRPCSQMAGGAPEPLRKGDTRQRYSFRNSTRTVCSKRTPANPDEENGYGCCMRGGPTAQDLRRQGHLPFS